jgi:hypothetical protein
MFFSKVRETLLDGGRIGYEKGYIEIVQTKNFSVSPHRMTVVMRSKKNIGDFKLGPLNKKVFINAELKELTSLKKIRANSSMRKEMYEVIVSGKQYKEV